MIQLRYCPTNRVCASLITVICLCGLLAPDASADSAVEKEVKTIRSCYDAVEKGLGRCKKVKRGLPDESAEGGELTGYFSDQSLRKLAAKFYGESGQALEEYYFWDGRLFFVLRVESRYDKPLSGKVKSKSEERFYFANGVLIRWLDSGKREVPPGREMQQRGRDWLAQAKRYSALVKN